MLNKTFLPFYIHYNSCNMSTKYIHVTMYRPRNICIRTMFHATLPIFGKDKPIGHALKVIQATRQRSPQPTIIYNSSNNSAVSPIDKTQKELEILSKSPSSTANPNSSLVNSNSNTYFSSDAFKNSLANFSFARTYTPLSKSLEYESYITRDMASYTGHRLGKLNPQDAGQIKHVSIIRNACKNPKCVTTNCSHTNSNCDQNTKKTELIGNTTGSTNSKPQGSNIELDPKINYSGQLKPQRAIIYNRSLTPQSLGISDQQLHTNQDAAATQLLEKDDVNRKLTTESIIQNHFPTP